MDWRRGGLFTDHWQEFLAESLWLAQRDALLAYCHEYFRLVWRYHYKYLRRSNPIIIYQMSKVGSQAVQKSLEGVMKSPVFHAHYLTNEALITKKKEAIVRGETIAHNARDNAKLRYIRKLVFTHNNKRWKVITLIREPIARGISLFFHKIDRDHKDLLNCQANVNLDQIVAQLLKRFTRKQHNNYHQTFTWFDNELKKTFGIDVFLTDFPKEKGYKIYAGERADVLLIRLESLNQCYREAFQEFLALDNLALISFNRSADKDYKDIYQAFQKSLEFPPTFLDKIYSSKHVCHFYTEEEIDRFKAKWSRSSNYTF
jgi:hypothetical protein